ncbi:MAG: hypothetical protein LBU27_09475 [Candidatus Peribacteria bacterium]|jgi:hypothetical protein|nr:hypothetical protein [Candidatus Peribacteria bacterium]
MPTSNKKPSLSAKKAEPKKAETKKAPLNSTAKSATKKSTPPKKLIRVSSDRTGKLTQRAASIKKIATQTEAQLQPAKLSKGSQKIPMRVRVFFGVSLLVFCIALYQAILRPALNSAVANMPTTIPEIIISDNEEEWIASQLTPTETTQGSGEQFLQQFYQTFSQKDITTLTTLFDAPLQKSTEIKQFFSAYKITPFIDNITANSILPEQIELLTTSPSGVEEYRYHLNYHLESTDQDFAETRVAKVKYTEN